MPCHIFEVFSNTVMLVTLLRCSCQDHCVGDFINENNRSQFSHHYLNVITNKNCLQHPPPTSMLPGPMRWGLGEAFTVKGFTSYIAKITRFQRNLS